MNPELPIPTSFIMDTNKGGIPTTVCACGVLMFRSMAQGHIDTCPTYQAWLADQTPVRE